jgi:LacI family gluconate utilization system Gnt-I transcriptional repressor
VPEPDNKKPKKSSVRWSPRTLPTMDDVARVTGFSQMTVSRAFLRSAPIKEETRNRILKAATKIGYYHNKAASSLASQRTRAFGIILPTLQDSIYVPFVDAARRVFEDQGFDHLLQTIDYTRGREMHAIGSLLSQRVRAILLPSIGHTPETQKLLQTLPIPMIEIGNIPSHPIHYVVGHSDADAGYLATRKLLGAGRRNIGIICGLASETSNARSRLRGYIKALDEAGLGTDQEFQAQVEHTIESGLDGLKRLLQSNAKLDGIVIGGEIWTSAIILHLLASGRKVPDDIAVVGIGEIELGPYLPVPLTYVALPRREAGTKSAELAVKLIRGEDVSEAVIKLPVNLVIGGTA